MSKKVPLWLDCDPGHDDAFAILLAAHHPNLEFLGISTIHGNASLEHTTSNALRILTAIGCDSIPVHIGTAKPFARNALHAADIHGESGLNGTDLLPQATVPPREARQQPAILAMRQAVLCQPKGTAWVVATGTWTNVAVLFVAFPEVAEWVAGVSLMGGAIGNGFSEAVIGKVEDGRFVERIGNTTRWAEFNVYCDPESAKGLLSNPLLQGKLIMIGLDVTHLALASEAVQQQLLYGAVKRPSIHPMRQMFYELLTFFANTYKDVFGFAGGPPLHDPLAVAAILDKLGFERFGFETNETGEELSESWIVNVTTIGDHGNDSQLGRTVLVSRTDAGVQIPRRIKHLNRFWDTIELALQRAEEKSAEKGVWHR